MQKITIIRDHVVGIVLVDYVDYDKIGLAIIRIRLG